MASVTLKNVCKAYGDVLISKNVDLTINEGEFVFNVEDLIHYSAFLVQPHTYQFFSAIYFAARAPPQSLI